MPTPKEKLEATAIALKKWRLAKKHRNSAVPQQLRLQVLALFEFFTISELKLALNLSNGVFYRWKSKPGREVALPTVEQPKVYDQAAEFITLPQSESVSTSNLSLEVTVGKQCHIRMSGDISVQQLDVFTRNIFTSQSGGTA
jgi:hypothetical protein